MMHTEIRINDTSIARVSIHRVRSSRDWNAPHVYRWRVTEGDESTGGDILHVEHSGAFALLAKVLAAYDVGRAHHVRH